MSISQLVVTAVAVAIEALLILVVVLSITGFGFGPVPDTAWPTPGSGGTWELPAPIAEPAPALAPRT